MYLGQNFIEDHLQRKTFFKGYGWKSLKHFYKTTLRTISIAKY